MWFQYQQQQPQQQQQKKVHNLQEMSLMSMRSVYDEMGQHGSIRSFSIENSLLSAC